MTSSTEPLREIVGSARATDAANSAVTLRIFGDRVETEQRKGFKRQTNTIPYDQAAQVVISKGMLMWATLGIESAGGHSISVPGIAKDQAPEIKKFIEGCIQSYRQQLMTGRPGSIASQESAPQSVADELKKLADLRVAGILSDEEFNAQKAKLLE